KQKSKLRIKLMQVRMEYSILGFIIITSHGVYQLIEYINESISIPIIGIIAYAIMIPLFITSFKIIRKKMTPKNWLNLQKLAYLVYIGLFIHLIINAEMPNLAIYIIGFIIYVVLKVLYESKKHRTKKKTHAI
ncbi:MAG TPA: ferric reductase-like transmembrane domain-containing protein, partial [Candidatus Izemoplasmatales bacterium]|nr:ferric reductase-like transmembrane domain-containing protein [Candidatus Izemoplasmatales bacterium]